MTTQTKLYIEKRKQGEYAIRKPGSERASAVLLTLRQSIKWARAMYPGASVYIECDHAPSVGGRDRWRLATEKDEAYDLS